MLWSHLGYLVLLPLRRPEFREVPQNRKKRREIQNDYNVLAVSSHPTASFYSSFSYDKRVLSLTRIFCLSRQAVMTGEIVSTATNGRAAHQMTTTFAKHKLRTQLLYDPEIYLFVAGIVDCIKATNQS